MAQDTRKDPRAKVLSMTVRYKSATVDEFIEHHSHDVSRGGIFIKTPSPFPPGTLLKFEIRIQDEQSVLAGVGRVVWKRDAGETGTESPAGMGVKFIKIDDKSKGLIQRLVESQPEGTASAFEAGKDGSGSTSDDVASDDATKRIENPAAAGAAVKPAQKRASTMLGLGSIGGSAKGDDKKESATDAPAKDEGFFPRTNPEKEMPPPEERTVMKQAAELLKQALAEAGGSLDDLKDLQAPTKEEARAAAAAAKEEPKPAAKAEPAKEAEAKKEEAVKEAEAKKEKDDVKVEAVAVAVAAVAKAATKEEPAAKPKAKAADKPTPAAEERAVAAKPAPKPLMQEPEESGGSGKMLTILLVVAGLGAAAWLLFGRTDPASTTGGTPENTAPTAMTAPVPTMTAAPVPTMTAAPVPTMTAAPTATAAASASSSAATKPSAAPTATAAAAVKTATPEPPKPPTVVTPPTPKPPTVVTPPVDKPKPVTKPKPVDDPYG